MGVAGATTTAPTSTSNQRPEKQVFSHHMVLILLVHILSFQTFVCILSELVFKKKVEKREEEDEESKKNIFGKRRECGSSLECATKRIVSSSSYCRCHMRVKRASSLNGAELNSVDLVIAVVYKCSSTPLCLTKHFQVASVT